MEVIIDDVKYVPMLEVPTDNGLIDALNVRFDSDAGENLTVRDYLHALLETLWDEEEGFSGKRPFGNSGWKYEIYSPLVAGGFISGSLDEDGNATDVDDEHAGEYVRKLIAAAFHGVADNVEVS